MGRFARASEGQSNLLIGLCFLLALLAGYIFSDYAQGGRAVQQTAVSVRLSAATLLKSVQAVAGTSSNSTAAVPGSNVTASAAGAAAGVAAAAGQAGKGAAIGANGTLNADSWLASLSVGPEIRLEVAPAPDLVTFILPSLGKPTVGRAVESLLNQTMQGSWRALLILSGRPDARLPPNITSDARVRSYALEKRLMTSPHLGALRNLGVKLAKTPWVAFLDEGDTLHPQYVERLLYEVQHTPKAEAVLFRTYTNESRLIPGPDVKDPPGEFPLSFAVQRRMCLKGFLFSKHGSDYLRTMSHARRPVLLSPFVSYFGNLGPQLPPEKKEEWSKLNRVLWE